MKIKINKKLRIGFMGLLAIMICFIVFRVLSELVSPGYDERQKSIYSYSSIADVKYEVELTPNQLFKKESLGEGKVYFTELVDNIETAISYEFYGERPTNIHGDYEVLAVVEGHTKSSEQERTIWSEEL